MRKWISIIVLSLLLVGGAIVCAIRWQAWFGTPAELQWTGDTIEYTFPSLTTDSNLTVLVLGDIHSKLTRADYDTLAARVSNADIVAQVGDWMDRGQFYYQQLLLREWTNSALYGLPVIACPGNHEYSKGWHKQLSQQWLELFPITDNGPQAVPGVSHYMDLPGVRFIILDTNPLDRLVYLTRTLTWLHNTMNSADNRFIVVLMHHPVFSACKGRFNPLIYTTFRYALGQADLVIAGHDHSYLRRAPFVVLNTSGKIKPQQSLLSAEVADTVPAYGVLQIESDPISDLRFTIYRMADGMAIDSIHVTHD